MIDLFDYLQNNDYPGRGILVGNRDKQKLIAYFIMGRSDNSRNRIFLKKEDILYTKAFDETKIKDPSLIIYNAIRDFKDQTIITNGNQTDTIYDFLRENKSFEQALETREYEPDAPNFTPRISAIMNEESYQIAILKKKDESCERLFYSYEQRMNIAHFISTYNHNDDPLPSFSKAPLEVKIEDDFDLFAECEHILAVLIFFVKFGYVGYIRQIQRL